MLSAADYRETICDVLIREFGNLRHGAEVVARMAGSTPRAAQNWFDKICAPQGSALLNLCAQCEAVNHEVERLKAMARGRAE